MPILSAGTIPECFLDILAPSREHVANHFFKSKMTWKDKQFKAIWRGSSTGGNAGDAYCQKYPGFDPGNVNYTRLHRMRLHDLCAKNKDCDY